MWKFASGNGNLIFGEREFKRNGYLTIISRLTFSFQWGCGWAPDWKPCRSKGSSSCSTFEARTTMSLISLKRSKRMRPDCAFLQHLKNASGLTRMRMELAFQPRMRKEPFYRPRTRRGPSCRPKRKTEPSWRPLQTRPPRCAAGTCPPAHGPTER